jgi:hypothetical protein
LYQMASVIHFKRRVLWVRFTHAEDMLEAICASRYASFGTEPLPNRHLAVQLSL